MLETDFPMPPAQASEDLTVRNDVLFGKDGWLFLYGSSHAPFAYLLGQRSPAEKSVATFWSNLEGRADYCVQRGIPYLHVVFPSKPVVMTRFLPDSIQSGVQSLYQRCYLPAAPRDLAGAVLYPVDELRDLDATDLPFLRNDTHMTDLGYSVVIQAALARWGMTYDVASRFRRETGRAECDLSRMLGEWDPPIVTVLRDDLHLAIADNRKFLPGNDLNITLLQSPHAATSKRLAVVGDSFFRSSLRFLAPVFRDILYLRGPGFHAETLDRFAPDAVMSGNAERYLANVPPDSAIPDILSSLTRVPAYHPDTNFQSALSAKLSGPLPVLPTRDEMMAVLRQTITDKDAQLASLREKNRDKSRKLQELRQARAEQGRRIAELEASLRTRRASPLWRLSGPIRRLGAQLRRPR